MTVDRPERVATFEGLGYGLFLHWGLYSALGRGEWTLHQTDVDAEDYETLAEEFTAEAFDARAIARTASDAGMNYVTLTARHHDGFSLYDTEGLSEYDAIGAAAGRDLVAEFVDGCRAEGVVPFCYHTTLDWRWGSTDCSPEAFNEYVDYLHASLEGLCEYDLAGVWLDGDWSRDDVDWRLDERYELLRSGLDDPILITNTGIDARGEVSHPEVDAVTYEQDVPSGPPDDPGIAAEACETLNRHWGRADRDYAYNSPADVIEHLAACRGVGANYLLNVGPTAAGELPAYETATIERVGGWVAAHPQVIEGRPVDCDPPGRDAVLATDEGLYYLAFDLAAGGSEDVVVGGGGAGPRAIGGLDRSVTGARWLDSGEELDVAQEDGLTTVDCTPFPYGTNTVVRVAELY